MGRVSKAGKGRKTNLDTYYRGLLLDYLCNPENPWPKAREEYANVLSLSKVSLYRHISPNDISEIERQALAVRRAAYSPDLHGVDRKMLENAKKGDVKAAKLIYERMEGLPVQRLDIGLGKDEPPAINIIVRKSE